MAFLPSFEPRNLLFPQRDNRNALEYIQLNNRLLKTLYYGKTPLTDRPSLPLTNIAVEFCQDASPKEFGRLDTDYASFVSRRSCMSPCSMMLAMIYIERLRHKNPEYLQTISSSDLFLISLMVASKYLYDEGVDEEVFNDEWAESAKMETEDLNSLERNFLGAIDWNLFSRPSDFSSILLNIEKRIAMSQGMDRGWFTYTDLYVLMEDLNYLDQLYNLARELSKMVLVCTVAYTASVLTLIGSTLLVSCLREHVASIAIGTPPISSVTEPTQMQEKEPTPWRKPVTMAEDFGPELEIDEDLKREFVSRPIGAVSDEVPVMGTVMLMTTSVASIMMTMTGSVTSFFGALLFDEWTDSDDDFSMLPSLRDQGKLTRKIGDSSGVKLDMCSLGNGCFKNNSILSWKGWNNLLELFGKKACTGSCLPESGTGNFLLEGQKFFHREKCCCDSKPTVARRLHDSIHEVMINSQSRVPIL